MTTNNPPIAAWAPSTALAKLASRHNNSPCVLTDGPAEFNDVALIRLSDYERLQAERDVLLNLLERSSEWVYPPDEGCRCDTCREALALSDAIGSILSKEQS